MLEYAAGATMPPLPPDQPLARDGCKHIDRSVRPGYTKIFVGEMGKNSTEDSVRSYFIQFGDVDRVVVKHHTSAKSSSCFAFVVINGDIDIIMNTPHVIDGQRVATPEIARQTRTKGDSGAPQSTKDLGCRKIFVGGLSHQTKETVLRAHFTNFGEVTDAVVLHDPGGGRPRGFGFVTFAEAQSARNVIACGRYHHVDGRHVEVKLAIPKAQMPMDAAATPTGVPPQQQLAQAPQGRNWMHQ